MIGNKPHSTETILIVTGCVQGVFFRAKTKRHADALGLKGYVKNLPNGAVEICIGGSDTDSLIARLKEEPLPVQIDKIEKRERASTFDHKTFLVK